MTGVEPSEGFLETARENLGDRATLMKGSATEIPLEDRSLDAIVSARAASVVPFAVGRPSVIASNPRTLSMRPE